MATIGNFQEAYTETVWWNGYEPNTPYWQSIASRISPGETYIEREMMMNNLYDDNARKIENLEREVRELNKRIMELEGALYWNYSNVLDRLNELEKSAWFSYVDLNKW